MDDIFSDGAKNEANQNSDAKIDHVSFSQVDMAMRCMRQYYYAYRMGLRQPPGAALAFGSGVGKGLEMGFRQIIDGRGMPAVSYLTDVFAETFKAKAREVDWAKEEKETPNHMLMIGDRLLTKYRYERMEQHQPVSVEEKIEIKLPSIPVRLIGALDLVDTDRKITDFKTASKKYSEGEADRSLQLRLYAAAKEISTGVPHPHVGFDILVKSPNPANVSLQVQDAMLSDSDKRQAVGTVSSIVTALLRLWDMPEYAWPVCNPKNNYLCGPKWCGYHTMCRANLEAYGEYKK